MSGKKEIETKEAYKNVLDGRKHVQKKGHKKTKEIQPGGEAGENETLTELAEQLRSAEEEAKNHYDKLLRAVAELNNVKKRTEREKIEVIRYGNEKLIKDLLPVLDDLERVLDHLPEGASKELMDFVKGVELVSRHLNTALANYGLKEVKTKDEEFDPRVHEAVSHLPNEEVDENKIIECHRKGYLLGDKLIRPAMVSVSKGTANRAGET